MATRQDTFAGRTVASGWGTASDGNVWTIQGGDGQSVASNEGVITNSTASTFATLGAAVSTADEEGLVRFNVTSNGTDNAGIVLRWTDANNHWLCRYYSGGGQVIAEVKIAGTYTVLSPAYTFTPTNGTYYWLRFRCQGTTISFKIWQDGTSEPSSWTEQYTGQSSQNVAGNVGLYGWGTSSGNHYDTFSGSDLGTTIALTGTIPSQSGLSSSLLVSRPLASAISSSAGLAGTLTVGSPSVHLSATLPSSASLAGSLLIPRGLAGVVGSSSSLAGVLSAGNPGTGIGDLTSSTPTISWTNQPGSPGTAYRDTYSDVTNSGWAVESVPTYGGMPIAGVYSDDGGTLTLEHSYSTNPGGGHIHWLEQLGGNWAGSEDVLFTHTELAPIGTLFRRYFQAAGNANDSNGFSWTSWACIYPGDPGLIAYRFDLHNPSASAITLDGSDGIEIALIGSLEVTDSTWQAANGGYGTIAGSDNVGWPSALTTIEPDYAYIIPASGGNTNLGQATVKKTSLAGLGWSNLQVQYLLNTDRLKFKVQSDGLTIAAGATQTVYLLQILRRNLTAADIRAIANDYLTPGTPSVATGSFTAFSYDEIAYEFAASSNALTTTLDATTTRYKPRFKVTGWTASTPKVVWGGTELTPSTDYRYTVDATNHILYLQVYADVVASGAGKGQINNAALAITDATVSLTGAIPSGSGLTAQLSVTRPLAGSVTSGATLSGTLSNGHRLQGTIPSGASLSGTLSVGSPTTHLQGSIPSSLGCSGSLSISRPLQGSLSGQGRLAGTLSISLLHGTLTSSAGCSGRLTIGRKLTAGIPSGAGCAGVLTVGQPTVHLTGAVPSGCGAVGSLTISRPLAGTVLPGSGLGGSLKLTSNLTATLLALTLADAALAALLLADASPAALMLADVEGA